jgi:hypothetical protein
MPLGFPELIGVLRSVQGTSVIVAVDPAPADDAEPSPLSMVGVLREPAETGDTADHVFWVGDPQGEGGGLLRLSAAAIRSATLSTFDGNDFFIVRIRWHGVEIRIQDENSGSP